MFLVMNGSAVQQYTKDNFNNYKDIICNKENKGYEISVLRQMHNLRFKVFKEQLKWTVGLDTHDDMEFDEFDNFDAKYLVHVNSKNRVDACTRILYTDKPFLLGQKYSDFITEEAVPSDSQVCETTRFAVNNDDSDYDKLFQSTIAAMLVWGLKNNIKNFVSLTTVGKLVRSLSVIGWDPKALGPEKNTPDDVSVALKYSASAEALTSVCTKSRIPCPNVFAALPK